MNKRYVGQLLHTTQEVVEMDVPQAIARTGLLFLFQAVLIAQPSLAGLAQPDEFAKGFYETGKQVTGKMVDAGQPPEYFFIDRVPSDGKVSITLLRNWDNTLIVVSDTPNRFANILQAAANA